MRTSKPPSSLRDAAGARASIALSALLVAAHILFGYAQLSGTGSDCPGIGSAQNVCPLNSPNDGLVEVVLRAELAYDARGFLAQSLTAVEQSMCGTSCPTNATAAKNCSALVCDTCLAVGPFGLQQSCDVRVDRAIMKMSYIYMVRELYSRDKDPNCYQPSDPSCTGVHPGRVSSAVLVAASFIWPHVKLLLLHVTFYQRLAKPSRRNRNYWLAFFGKWTLIDVLVWCACIGVMHGLSVQDSILSLWAKVEPSGIEMCTGYCNNHTSLDRLTCASYCRELDRVLDASLLHPADLPRSSVDVRLEFVTKLGTYLFCVAVVLSLSCSVAVDALEDSLEDSRRPAATPCSTAPPQRAPAAASIAASSASPASPAAAAAAGASSSTRHGDALPCRAEMGTGELPLRESRPTTTLLASSAGAPPHSPLASCVCSEHCPARLFAVHTAAVMLQLYLTWCAVTLTLFRREVGGAIPAALKALPNGGFDFDDSFTLVDLARLASGTVVPGNKLCCLASPHPSPYRGPTLTRSGWLGLLALGNLLALHHRVPTPARLDAAGAAARHVASQRGRSASSAQPSALLLLCARGHLQHRRPRLTTAFIAT